MKTEPENVKNLHTAHTHTNHTRFCSFAIAINISWDKHSTTINKQKKLQDQVILAVTGTHP
jgi:hypothetical protein